MAVAVIGTPGSLADNGTTAIQGPITVPTGSGAGNRGFLAFPIGRSANDCLGVTLGGVSLTQLRDEVLNATNRCTGIFWLPSLSFPADGTQTLQGTFNDALSDGALGYLFFEGASQSTPATPSYDQQGTATSVSPAALSHGAGALIASVVNAQEGGASGQPTNSDGLTVFGVQGGTPRAYKFGYELLASAGSESAAWASTVAFTHFAAMNVVIEAAGGAPAASRPPLTASQRIARNIYPRRMRRAG